VQVTLTPNDTAIADIDEATLALDDCVTGNQYVIPDSKLIIRDAFSVEQAAIVYGDSVTDLHLFRMA
jgi:hypothetical protein